jgi:hypothetical protein
MNERTAQLGIYHRYMSSGMWIPNWCPPNWWEADLARIMPSGRWHEVEIKLTVGDFNADRRKGQQPYVRGLYGKHTRVKHLELRAGDERGPNQFYYAMPDKVAASVELPPFAGLITLRDYGSRCRATIKVKAPILHTLPMQFTPPEKNVFYYRMWSAIERSSKP